MLPLPFAYPRRWHAQSVQCISGTRDTKPMSSQRMALVGVACERSATRNESVEDGDTPNNEDSQERLTPSKRTPREQRVSPPADVVTHVMACEFDCGPAVPRSRMINKGNVRSPCWVCPPCFFSMKALIRSWSATPESKLMLDDMRSNSKSQWYALVRQCRITSSPS